MDHAALMARFGSPLYVYEAPIVRQRCRQLRAAIDYAPFQPLYAIKANPCPALARLIVEEGFGIDAVSPGEVALALRLDLDASQILFTENNMTDLEQAAALDAGVLINCGSLDRFKAVCAAGAPAVSVRFNPDIGAASDPKVLTAGPLTKFGVHHSQVAQVRAIAAEHGVPVIGCHMHIGSGSLNAATFVDAMRVILGIARELPDLQFIDFGGGIGVPYRPDDEAMDLKALGAAATQLMREFCRDYGRELALRLEPGRFLVAEAGSLLCTVTSVKTNPDGRCFVGTDSGFNHLVRPCMYGSYHHIDNLSNPSGTPVTVDVVGNICESGDIFAHDRQIPQPRVGDVLAIRDVGAYGMAMASTYNTRPLPAEVIIDVDEVIVARERQTLEELLAGWHWH